TLRTVVRIHPLDLEERKVELAQIASGEVVTGEAEGAKVAIDFAESLLQQAAHIRSGQTPDLSEVEEKARSPKTTRQSTRQSKKVKR
ncbi:MAG: hypothetical protein H7237_07940, partial [Alkalinema sp. FL-bin-369]|nr:hypothetical protein [Leptolyngbyaceae cyanobacterium LF-bin-369]